MSIENMCRR